MEALKVKDLYVYMKREIENGREDYAVLVTDDDEANGYHYLWYGPEVITEAEKPLKIEGVSFSIKIDTSDNVAEHDKHIVIG